MSVKLVGILVSLVVAIGALVGAMSMHVVPATPSLGATPGNAVDGSEFSVGGLVKNSRGGIGFTATSSIFCAVQNNTGATTSIAVITTKINSILIPSVPVFYISTSSSQYASSTPGLLIAATTATGSSAVRAPVATTTAVTQLAGSSATGASYWLLAPKEWVVWKLATSTPGVFAAGYLTGTCGFDGTEI